VIQRRGDPSFAPDVLALLCRLDPEGEIPQPVLWERCAAFLLEHRLHVDEVLRTFASTGARSVAGAALLALKHAPALGPPLLRRAIRSPVPHDRIVGAAVLALLAAPWCSRALAEVLAETGDHERTAECRAALRALGDPEGAVAAWEAAHPRALEAGPFVTMRELALRTADEMVLFEMDQLRPRVERIFIARSR
jgi:hypothetical protein